MILGPIKQHLRLAGAYKKIFCDDIGRLKPEAEFILNDLLCFAGFDKDKPPDAPLAMYEGRAQTVRRVLKKSGINLNKLAGRMKKLQAEQETDDE